MADVGEEDEIAKEVVTDRMENVPTRIRSM